MAGVGIGSDVKVASKHHFGLAALLQRLLVRAVPDTSGGLASVFPIKRTVLGGSRSS
jgi:hypothetical protein